MKKSPVLGLFPVSPARYGIAYIEMTQEAMPATRLKPRIRTAFSSRQRGTRKATR
jgi:hypothetical protein